MYVCVTTQTTHCQGFQKTNSYVESLATQQRCYLSSLTRLFAPLACYLIITLAKALYTKTPPKCLRYLCGFTWRDHRTNVSVRHSCHLPSIASEVRFRRLRWLGHVARMPDERLPVQVLFGQLSGPGVKGRPRDSWRTVVHKDLSALKVG